MKISDTQNGAEVLPGSTPAGPGISWRSATAADLLVLRVLHFPVEVESGRAMHIPDESFTRTIFVAERDGKIVGGALAEHATVVTMLGQLDKEVAKSAYEGGLVPAILQVAREDGCRFVEIRLPRDVRLDLNLETGGKSN